MYLAGIGARLLRSHVARRSTPTKHSESADPVQVTVTAQCNDVQYNDDVDYPDTSTHHPRSVFYPHQSTDQVCFYETSLDGI
jgi:hypothetical protein